MAQRSFRSHWVTQTILATLLFALIVAVVDFILYTQRVDRMQPPEPMPTADAVVVLTGAPGRIPVALDLVAKGAGARVLVSGVHPDTTLDQIRENQGGPADIYACCTDLGALARSTIGNGVETAEWARANGYTSLIVVTSDYHMPRSLIELRRAMPDVELYPYPVRTSLDPGAVWSDVTSFRGLVYEWAKYRITWVFRAT